MAVCFACIVARARRCFRAAPIVAFVVDVTDPLGAALAEMVRRLRCGFLCRSAPRPCAPHAFVLGAASLSDLQIIASGLATADRWLHAEGDRRQTPGAAALSAQLARAESSRTVFVTEGVRSVRALSQDPLSPPAVPFAGALHRGHERPPPC